MSLNYEMARYTELTGEDGTKVPISRLGGYLDGYAKGKKDGYNQALDDFAEQFKAHCRKFTTKAISDADIDFVKNELKR